MLDIKEFGEFGNPEWDPINRFKCLKCHSDLLDFMAKTFRGCGRGRFLRNIHKAHILRDPLVFDHLFIDRTEDGSAVLNRSRIVPLNPTFTFAQRVEINRAVARCFLHPIDEAAPLALVEHIDHMISVIVVGLFFAAREALINLADDFQIFGLTQKTQNFPKALLFRAEALTTFGTFSLFFPANSESQF
jgi:hypothetical protein